jgi:hypothetical protein
MLIPRSIDIQFLKMFPAEGMRRSGCPEINNVITIQEVQWGERHRQDPQALLKGSRSERKKD